MLHFSLSITVFWQLETIVARQPYMFRNNICNLKTFVSPSVTYTRFFLRIKWYTETGSRELLFFCCVYEIKPNQFLLLSCSCEKHWNRDDRKCVIFVHFLEIMVPKSIYTRAEFPEPLTKFFYV